MKKQETSQQGDPLQKQHKQKCEQENLECIELAFCSTVKVAALELEYWFH